MGRLLWEAKMEEEIFVDYLGNVDTYDKGRTEA